LKNLSLLFSFLFFSGCQNIFNKEGAATGGVVSSVIEFIDTTYPFFGFLGLIILAISINTLILSNLQSKHRFFIGFTELGLAIFFILSKNIIYYFFK
jgi:hypothetical protein